MSLRLFLTLFLFLNMSCSTYPERPGMNLMSESQINNIIKKYSAGDSVYSGLYNALEVHATIHNTHVLQALADQNARVYQLDSMAYQQEKDKQSIDAQLQTGFFVSFFTPERKHDDLAKFKTIWKIFLDVNGRRFEGKAVKIKKQVADLQAFYPYHNRWSTAYKVTFPVPTREVENAKNQLTFTGPVGSLTLEIAAMSESLNN